MCLFGRFLAILCLFFALSVCWADDIITDDNISEDIVSGDVDVVPSEAADEVEITVPLKAYPQMLLYVADSTAPNISVVGTPGSVFVRRVYTPSGVFSFSQDITMPPSGIYCGYLGMTAINVFSQGDACQVVLTVDASAGLPGIFGMFLDYLFFVNLDLRNNLVPALAVMMTAAIGVVFAWWGLRKMYLVILQSWRNGRITL